MYKGWIATVLHTMTSVSLNKLLTLSIKLCAAHINYPSNHMWLFKERCAITFLSNQAYDFCPMPNTWVKNIQYSIWKERTKTYLVPRNHRVRIVSNHSNSFKQFSRFCAEVEPNLKARGEQLFIVTWWCTI